MSDNIEQYQSEDFAAYIERERMRLDHERNRLQSNRANIDAQLADIDREFAAIDAYEQAKVGKPVAAKATTRTRHTRREMAEPVMEALATAPAYGLRRVDIIEMLGVKGDKTGEMSVSNALTRLKNQGRIARREDGHWVISEPLQEAAE